VLRDEEPLGDLVRREVLLEQQQHLDLPSGEHACDVLRDAVRASSFADTVHEPARDAAREGRVSAGDAAEERRDLLGRLRLQEVARGACANRGEEVLLGVRRGEHDDLALRGALADQRKSREPVHARHREVEEHDVGLERACLGDGLASVLRLADHVEALLSEQAGERVPRQRVVVDDEDPLGHDGLIGTHFGADKWDVDHVRSQSYRSWLLGEVLLVCLLAAGTALFAANDSLQSVYELHDARLAFDTAVAVVAGFVCVLTSVRFLVEGRALDLLLAAGFLSIALGTIAFSLVPALGGTATTSAAWTFVGARLLGAGLIAVAPFVSSRLSARRVALAAAAGGVGAVLLAAALGVSAQEGENGLGIGLIEGAYVRIAAALLAVLWLVAVIGFGLRYRRYGRDFDSWMCLAATLALFADLHLVSTPIVSSDHVLQGDFLRLVAYGTLLVGVWRAISEAEFGRAVADERARVAREIHDGLAQYLFAISTQVSMLESGAPLEQVLPRLKSASTSAQQEARFAVLALSSAGGSARFDAALRRYVEVLTADGALDVELDFDPGVRLAPDEQIEVFRIVQEGLGNARRHAGASHVEVTIGQRTGRRVVTVSDDGVGFDSEAPTEGQGVANMRLRARAIEGDLSVSSKPGSGTAVEIVLRPA
jgi:signal transduction histidine kinase